MTRGQALVDLFAGEALAVGFLELEDMLVALLDDCLDLVLELLSVLIFVHFVQNFGPDPFFYLARLGLL